MMFCVYRAMCVIAFYDRNNYFKSPVNIFLRENRKISVLQFIISVGHPLKIPQKINQINKKFRPISLFCLFVKNIKKFHNSPLSFLISKSQRTIFNKLTLTSLKVNAYIFKYLLTAIRLETEQIKTPTPSRMANIWPKLSM